MRVQIWKMTGSFVSDNFYEAVAECEKTDLQSKPFPWGYEKCPSLNNWDNSSTSEEDFCETGKEDGSRASFYQKITEHVPRGPVSKNN